MERREERSLLFKSGSPGDRQRGKYNYPLKLRQKMDQEHRKTGEVEDKEKGEKGETNSKCFGGGGGSRWSGASGCTTGEESDCLRWGGAGSIQDGATDGCQESNKSHTQPAPGGEGGEGGQRNDTEREKGRQGKWRTERERDKERGRKREREKERETGEKERKSQSERS